MKNNESVKPDYLFEISWEVCHKVGGEHKVFPSESVPVKNSIVGNHIFIGPDVWMDEGENPAFVEDTRLMRSWREWAASQGLRVRVGHWTAVESAPIAILVNYKNYFGNLDKILGDYWEKFQVDSITGDWDYKDFMLFGYAAGKAVESFYLFNLSTTDKVVAEFHEWTSGSGLLYLHKSEVPVATVMTTYGLPASGVASSSLERISLSCADAIVKNPVVDMKEYPASYRQTYMTALGKMVDTKGEFPIITNKNQMQKLSSNEPSWNTVLVSRQLPENLRQLEPLSKNLWWCWNESARNLFKSIDPQLWKECGENPIALLDNISVKRYSQLSKDSSFLAQYNAVTGEFNEYMALKAARTNPSVAYFCMEYGLDTSLKIYSGGLGILAGDYLKETSDMNVNLVAIGLLYRYGYFTQMLTAQGEQVSKYDGQDFLKTPATPVRDADGNWISISLAFPGRNLHARVWRVDVGRTELYLLDTDYEDNLPEDRQVTHHLYGGDWENRLKQEILLGIGGIRLVRKLGIKAQVYHCNEGHAAFTGLERLREYVNNDNIDFQEALEVVRSSSLFTTHTPVPAGHDSFDEGMLRKYLGHYPQRLHIDWETMMGLGKINGYDVNEKFSMSILAANISQNTNGVSWLHGEVSRDILGHMWPGYLPEELHISYVTNGVHYPTWTADLWKDVHSGVFGEAFKTHHYDKSCFEGIYKVSDEKIWEVRTALRHRLIEAVCEKLSDPSASSHYSPRQIVKIKKTLRDDVLTIGFARRFATYKRAHLLFRDLDRLDQIVNNPERPVQFLFAGKAHPADKAGQDLIKMIVDISKQDRFIGKIVFVPNYDITIAKYLVQGVDVWMNNPTRPLEASGTSGEKAAMNGVMHFSVLDGWWVEGYRPGAGWALPQERTYDNQDFQDELDAATIYNIIENDIASVFYNVDSKNGRSSDWIEYVRNTIAQVACNFTTNRMLSDYVKQYYEPQSLRYESLIADDFGKARQMAAWKKKLRCQWNDIEVISMTKPDSSSSDLTLGKPFKAEAVVAIGTLKPEDIGVEVLFAKPDKNGKMHITEKYELTPSSFKEGVATYSCEVSPERSGVYRCSARIFAKNPEMPHRQDFELVKWL